MSENDSSGGALNNNNEPWSLRLTGFVGMIIGIILYSLIAQVLVNWVRVYMLELPPISFYHGLCIYAATYIAGYPIGKYIFRRYVEPRLRRQLGEAAP